VPPERPRAAAEADARLELAAIRGRSTEGYFELRWRTPYGMRSEFVALADIDVAAERAVDLGTRTDVYVSAAPRTRREGTAAAVDRTHLLWADLDDPQAVGRAREFRPAASLLVATSPGRALALWALREPLAARWVARANLRLAHAVGGDPRATDVARILRIPGTVNCKRGTPTPVEFLDGTGDVHTARDVVGHLPDPPHPATPRTLNAARSAGRAGDDPLLAIPASEYVPALTGRPVGRDGKARCPWHSGGQERTPSLHAYSDAARGWRCYACDAGGTIIDFGARLYGIAPRGRGFHDVRRRLAADLLGHAEALAA
jgi:hypothetical protein